MTMTNDFGNLGPGLGQAQKWGGIKLLNAIPTPALLIILISTVIEEEEEEELFIPKGPRGANIIRK